MVVVFSKKLPVKAGIAFVRKKNKSYNKNVFTIVTAETFAKGTFFRLYFKATQVKEHEYSLWWQVGLKHVFNIFAQNLPGYSYILYILTAHGIPDRVKNTQWHTVVSKLFFMSSSVYPLQSILSSSYRVICDYPVQYAVILLAYSILTSSWSAFFHHHADVHPSRYSFILFIMHSILS